MRRELFRQLGRLRAFDIASEVGPGDPGLAEAGWLAAGLRRAESGRRTGRRRSRIIPEILLEVLDRAGRIAGREAGAAHREQEPGAQARAFGQLARLGHQLVGGVGVGLERRDRRARAASEQRPGKHRRAGLCVAGEQADGLVASQLLGGRRVARGQLDARQLETELGGPAACRGCLELLSAVCPGPRRAGRESRSAMAWR